MGPSVALESPIPTPSAPISTLFAHAHMHGLTQISHLFGSVMSATLLARISCAQLPPTVTQTAHSGTRAHTPLIEGGWESKKKTN